MSYLSVLETLRNKGIKLNLDVDGNLKAIGPKEQLDEDLLHQLRENRADLLAWLKEAPEVVRPKITAVPRQSDRLPTSFAQQRLWFIDQLGGGSPQYNMPGAMQIEGEFDEDVAEEAFRRIVARHEPLRTVFVNEGAEALQWIREDVGFALRRVDLSGLDEQAQEAAVTAAVNADAFRPFDLQNDLMLRAGFLRLSPDGGVLLFNMHHIASDGWSMGILINEFGAQYEAVAAGEPDPLPRLPIQYSDYAQWQRQWLEGEVLDRQLDYWETQLADLPQVHSLPLDRPRPRVQSFNGAVHGFALEGATVAGLKRLALSQGATLFMVLQGTFALLLSRYGDTGDVVMGTPVANRLQKELEGLVGFFVNTLVLRTDCSDDVSFRQYLGRIRAMHLDAQGNQDVPFEYLVERLQPVRSARHSPLFQIVFSMDTNQAQEARLSDLSLRPLGGDGMMVKFELTLNAAETEDGLRFSFVYNRDLFDASTIERMGTHLGALLRGVAADPDRGIHALPMLGRAERTRLLNEFNDAPADFPRVCIQELFERQVERDPSAPALRFEDQTLSYGQLNARANQVAHRLIERGVGPDTLVGLCAERSPEMVVGILGVLKAGGAYVPLDPAYPEERLRYMLEDCAAKLVLTQRALIERLPMLEERALPLDAPEAFADCPETNPRVEGPAPSHLAYVIYTSGSTGRPKGVMVEHHSLSNLAANWAERQPKRIGAGAWGWVASFAFDGSVKGLAELALGRPLAVIGEDDKQDAAALRGLIEKHDIGVLDCTPSLLEVWFALGLESALPDLVIGGEPISGALWKRLTAWRERHGRVALNVYGPTECCVNSAWCEIRGDSPHIGRPLKNTQAHVVNSHGELAPIGCLGELRIGGEGVARGYLNQAELTAERFVADPYGDDPRARLYRTGDYARRRADGTLEFFGRIDNQVKIRGFRVELGEIEAQLTRLEAVRSAVALAREDQPGDRRLVAYVTLDEPGDGSGRVPEIRAGLRKALPEYMVPGAIVVLDEFPLTANGKVDRRALPAPDGALLGGEYVAPSTEAETALVGIWAELLGLEADRVSARANFFELGGHSLLSVRLVAEVRARLDVELSIREVFETPRLSELAERVELNRGQSRRAPVTRIERAGDRVPTSFAQQRLWFIDQLGGGSPQYNMPGAMRIEGGFDEDVAEEAFRRIVARHEPLRTVFVNEGAEALQWIREDVGFALRRVDLSGLDEQAQEAAVTAAVNADAVKAFDLRDDLMLRAAFLRLSPDGGVLLYNMHHIASDGWSMGILFDEFEAQYDAVAAGEPDPMPPLPVRYGDYAQWQRQWLEGEVLDRQLDYWETQLADLPQVHSLPLDRPRPRVPSFNGAVHGFNLDVETVAVLKRLALSEGATLFMVLQGTFALLLSRYGDTGDVVMGTPVANRLQKELEGLVGFFVNTLVLRTDCSKDVPFREHLARIRAMNLDAQANQDVPFEYLVERLQPARSVRHSPLFQIVFNMDTNGASETGLSDVSVRRLGADTAIVKFELTLNAAETEDGLRFTFVYNRDLFDASTIERMGTHLCALLRGVAADPDRAIHALPMLGEVERRRLLHEFNDVSDDFPRACIQELFERQVERDPTAPALRFEDQALSYGQLNARANQVAHRLIERGVGPDTLVGLCAERSPEMMVGILGVLKAGGAYVPLDPAYPEQRLRYMLEDSAAKLVLTQRALIERLPMLEERALPLDDPEAFADLPETNPRVGGITPSHLAYVIYTSGSTGQPKGVMVEHLGVARLVSAPEYMPLNRDTVFLQASSISFDAATLEIWGSLLNGGCLVLLGPGPIDFGLMEEEINRSGVNTLILMAPLLAQWSYEASEPCPLRWIVTGGDVVDPQAVRRVYERLPEVVVINGYGPTENTTVSSCHPIPRGFDPTRPLPLGVPVKGSRNYVVSSRGTPAPIGVAGELLNAGAGVARGYLNRPGLTAERFVPDPFAEDGHGRLYRTGDLVRRLADGTLEFLGRADNQVKVRGFRIELGEIEHRLLATPEVEAAVVLALEDETGDKRLVAYVRLGGDDDSGERMQTLKARLQAALPGHMVPQAFVLMDEFPLTANGKVDKAKLPSPDYALAQGEYVAPEGETETALVGIWAELLGLEADRVSARANFFELGGHSLLSVRLVAEVRARLDVELSIREVFETPRLSELAERVELNRGQSRRAPVTRIERAGDRVPTSFAQQRLWFIDQLGGGSPQYNMPGAMRIEGGFDEDAAEEAFRRIVARHEPLRTVFVNEGAEALQWIREDVGFALRRVDLSGLDEQAQEAAVTAAVNADAVKAFDLRDDLMLRAAFLRLSPDGGVLLYNMHHIASDGWSMGILFDEFEAQYDAVAAGEPDPMPPLPVRYGDYAQWQRQWLEGEVLDRQLDYWETQLADLPQVHSLPLDRPRPRVQSFNGAVHGFALDQQTLAGLKRLALSEGATLFMVLQGTFALLLSRYGDTGDVVMGTPVANRLQKELEGLVGFFVNTLVLRTDCSKDVPFREHLAGIRAMNLDAQANQDVPFEYLVERLQPARSVRHSPLFQIVFNMDTNQASDAGLSDLSVRRLGADGMMVKFELTLNAAETEDGLRFSFVYNRDLFDASTIERMGTHLCALLRGVAADPDRGVHALPMLGRAERTRLLNEFNDAPADFPRACIQELFERQVERDPTAPALRFEDQTLSYGQLNARANQVAHRLIERGVGPDTLVGLCAERSPEMVVGILGVLKAGGAYVPLDPAYPEERLRYMLEDCAAELVLTQRALLQRLPVPAEQAVVLDAPEAFADCPETNPRVEGPAPSHLAYLIYTSGSTGRPKGVMVEHHSLSNLVANWAKEQPKRIGAGAWGWIASFAFDASVNAFAELALGRPLAVIGEDDKQDAAALRGLIEKHDIGVLDCTPSLLEVWFALGLESALPDLVIGGEPISDALWTRLNAWRERRGRVALNVYGPTECCVNCTWCEIGGDSPHIGRPFRNTQAHVVNSHGELAPIGCLGELRVGGECVGRGYLNQAELTAERFVADPYSDDPRARLYRTGDSVRRLADGTLDFIGRVDDQVKIRGFRVELGEIEAQLTRLEAVRSAVALAREDQPGDRRLVAYVTLDEPGDGSGRVPEIRAGLRKALPEYMVPGAIVVLDEFPLTANGKVDRRALPAPDGALLGGEYVAPSTEAETALVGIWAELLGLEADRVSARANFFELGGHSLLSVRLVAEVRARLDVELSIREVFETPRLSELAERVELNRGRTRRAPVTRIERAGDRVPTSFAQQRLWFIDQLGGGSPQYNMPGAMRIEGGFDEDVAEEAFRRIVARHEPLRTVFVNEGAEALQWIREDVGFALRRVDLSGLDEQAQEAAVTAAVNADAVKAFDLRDDLMLRAAFLRLSPDGGVLLYNMHHIASDGWSMGILFDEFEAQYDAVAAGEPDPMPPLPVRYGDYAQWQRQWLEGEVLDRQLDYWETQLADLPQVHSLPLDRPRPRVQSFNGAVHGFALDQQTLAGLKRLALSEGATLFMVLQGTFALLLSRYGDTGDVVMGTPVANRLQKELEGLVGFFVNTLVLRTDCSKDVPFREYLAGIRAMNLDAQANQDVPFEYLVERLQPARSVRHSPLFQIVFNMDTNQASDAGLSDLSVQRLGADGMMVKFELTLNAAETEDGLRFSFVYNRDLFDASTIERMGTHLCALLRGVAADPDRGVHALPMLGRAERTRLLNEFNDAPADFPRACIQELFERQVERDPSAPALRFEDQTLSYGQLNARANQVAHRLIERGVGPDTLVGLCAERSPEMVVGILGVLKAGGAYVPLDPAYPEERLRYMLEDCAAELVLTQRALLQRLPVPAEQAVVLDDPEAFADCPETNPRVEGPAPSHLAYVIYTSGSTGRPKGVMVEHHSLSNLVANWAKEQPKRIGAGAWGWIASFAFDASVNAFAELALGRPLAVIGEDDKQDAAALRGLIEKHDIGVLDCTPSLLEVWFALGLESALPDLVIGGEPISDALWTRLNAWRERRGRVALNVYGPTECCVNCTWCEIGGDSPHIGRPFRNTQAHVVNSHGELAPIGCLGELRVGGECVGRGYLNQAELTAERFVADPYSDDPRARLYRTGDSVRRLADGTLDFIGRVDDQVKIRGFRVELGEIEAQLTRLEAVRSAVALAREDQPGDRRLVAYVTLDEPGDGSGRVPEIRAGLRKALPEYMVPGAIVVLDEFPLTANGKVDRRALPAPDGALLGGEYVAPSTEAETALVGIWAELLGLEADRVSARANFFELGGHSLLSVRLVAEVRARLDVELSIREVFETPRLSELAERVELNRGRSRREPVTRIERAGDRVPTSFAQQRLWFIDQLGGGSPQYNMPGAMRIEGGFDEDAAEEAFRRIVARHEPLRTVFVNEGAEALQWIREDVGFALRRVDLSGLDEQAQEAAVTAAVNADAVKAFDLRDDLMLRAAFLRLSPDGGVLLYNMHHIASDGWSMGILFDEFEAQYDAVAAGEPDPMPPLPVRYGDYAQWQRQWLEGEVLDRQLDYWETQLADLPQVHSLPLDRPRPRVQSFNGAVHGFALDQQTLAGLKRLALSEGATLFMVLQGTFALLLSRYGDTGDVVMGTPVANRLQKELEGLVGFFVNTLVLRTDCSKDVPFREYLAGIRAMNLDAQANQDVPFEYLVERLQPARSVRHSPLFQIVFNMDTNQASDAGLSDLSVQRLGADGMMVKFELTLNAAETEDGLRFSFVYNRDLFDASTIERMGTHLCALLRGVAADPERGVHALPMLGRAERTRLLNEFNDAPADFPRACIQELFERQVERDPSAPALRFEDQTLSYGQLNARANQVAHRLIERGVGPDTLVGLCAERSPEMVVGILGVLKAGGAYVPLDPAYPEERLRYMLEDCAAELVLTQRALLQRLPVPAERAVVLDDPEAFADCPETNPRVEGPAPSHLAYVIYTSGSTGRPKGVMVEHLGVTRLVSAPEYMTLDRNTVYLQASSISFDAATLEIWGSLLNGGCLALLEPGPIDFRLLEAAIERSGVNTLFLTAPLFAQWSHEVSESCPLRWIVTGGDVVDPQAVRRVYERLPEVVVINAYGPTENTTLASCHPIPRGFDPTRPLPLGAPVKGSRNYVVSSRGTPAPIGVAGELLNAGAGVARGYLNRPGLTAERFVPDPFSEGGHGRLYRTGDLVRRLADGTLEFLGRADNQVKVRGFRIELGEIEHLLLATPDVEAAVVLALEDETGSKRLVAYVRLRVDDDSGERMQTLKARLQAALPDYMVPRAFVPIDKFPLTANGKVDKSKLPSPDKALAQGEYVAPEGKTETELARIWATALNLEVERLSVTSNFFDLGGHSLLAPLLISQMNQALESDLAVMDLFRLGTIQNVAKHLESEAAPIAPTFPTAGSGLSALKPGSRSVAPLVLVHPVGGQVHCYAELATTLSYPGSVYGVQAGADNGSPTSIEAMAADYLRALADVEPTGPYVLGGWSMGGVLAYEMARQLVVSGGRPPMVIMIDSHRPGLAPEAPIDRDSVDIQRSLLATMAAELGITDESLGEDERAALQSKSLEELLQVTLTLGKTQRRLPENFRLDDLRARFNLLVRNERAFRAYVANGYRGDVALLRATENTRSDRDLGWASVAPRLTVSEVPGDHFSVMRRSNLTHLKSAIDGLLQVHVRPA